MKEYDILVVGAGAGTKLVTPPSRLGKKVAVFEKETPGGTCLNRGCIPSKMLIYPSELLHQWDNFPKFSLSTESRPKVRFAELVDRIQTTVAADANSIPITYEKNPNIEYYQKKVHFVRERILSDGDEEYTAKHIFLVTGTRPKIPNFPGLSSTPFWTSREALSSKELPKSMVVLGAGFIALELGAAYQNFGTKVTGITRSNVLRNMDGDIRKEFSNHLPFPYFSQAEVISVTFEKDNFNIEFLDHLQNKQTIIAEKLLVATGILPNTDDLGLENTSIERDDQGFIRVNEYLETTAKDVYAFGDVIGRHFFRHSANFEGEFLFENLYQKEKKQPIRYPAVPQAVFTTPQIASVGYTEEELENLNIPFWKGLNPYSSSATGMARLSQSGFVKVLVSKKTEEVLGAHIIGDEAANLLHQILLGIQLNAKLDDYLSMIYIHPAISEITRNAFRKVKEEKTKEKL